MHRTAEGLQGRLERHAAEQAELAALLRGARLGAAPAPGPRLGAAPAPGPRRAAGLFGLPALRLPAWGADLLGCCLPERARPGLYDRYEGGDGDAATPRHSPWRGIHDHLGPRDDLYSPAPRGQAPGRAVELPPRGEAPPQYDSDDETSPLTRGGGHPGAGGGGDAGGTPAGAGGTPAGGAGAGEPPAPTTGLREAGELAGRSSIVAERLRALEGQELRPVAPRATGGQHGEYGVARPASRAGPR